MPCCNSLTLKIAGDLMMDVPTVTGRSRIVGDVTAAARIGATLAVEASGNIVHWTNPAGGLSAPGDVQPTGAAVAASIRGAIGTNVKLTDVLPSGLTWTITGDTATCSPVSPVSGGQTLTCNFGTMAQGTSKTITLSASTTGIQYTSLPLTTSVGHDDDGTCLTISNTAKVTSSNDTNSINNSAGPVNISVDCKPDVSVSKKTSASTITPGRPRSTASRSLPAAPVARPTSC